MQESNLNLGMTRDNLDELGTNPQDTTHNHPDAVILPQNVYHVFGFGPAAVLMAGSSLRPMVRWWGGEVNCCITYNRYFMKSYNLSK